MKEVSLFIYLLFSKKNHLFWNTERKKNIFYKIQDKKKKKKEEERAIQGSNNNIFFSMLELPTKASFESN